MNRIFSAILVSVVSLSACQDKAEIPVYLRIDDYRITTNFATEGTASSKITTVWIEADNQTIGAYELPVVAPVIANGPTNIRVIPGINLNGTLSLRNQYEFYKAHEFTLDAAAGTEVLVQTGSDGYPITSYTDWATVVKVEDFEGVGSSFETTQQSALVTIELTQDSSEVFQDENLSESNLRSGKIVVPEGPTLVEFVSLNTYQLPTFSQNVYLELNYKCETPFTFGIFANLPQQRIQAPVATILPSETWNKIYINLVTEVSGYPNALNYNLFFGTLNAEGEGEKVILIDNLKLVY